MWSSVLVTTPTLLMSLSRTRRTRQCVSLRADTFALAFRRDWAATVSFPEFGHDGIEPALFRARAFERDWVAPFRDKNEWLWRMERFVGAHDPLVEMWHVLMFEAGEWLALGQRVGLFPDEFDPDPNLGVFSTEWRDYARERIESHLRIGVMDWRRHDVEAHLQRRRIARAVTDFAFANLRAERLAYVCLVVFADDDLWTVRVDEVRGLSASLAQSPLRGLQPTDADFMSWGLDGSEATSVPDFLPAAWRGPNLGLGTGEAESDRARKRVAELEAARAPMLESLSVRRPTFDDR